MTKNSNAAPWNRSKAPRPKAIHALFIGLVRDVIGLSQRQLATKSGMSLRDYRAVEDREPDSGVNILFAPDVVKVARGVSKHWAALPSEIQRDYLEVMGRVLAEMLRENSPEYASQDPVFLGWIVLSPLLQFDDVDLAA